MPAQAQETGWARTNCFKHFSCFTLDRRNQALTLMAIVLGESERLAMNVSVQGCPIVVTVKLFAHYLVMGVIGKWELMSNE
jgi:hypothetical protein